jgi:hypothetical protein
MMLGSKGGEGPSKIERTRRAFSTAAMYHMKKEEEATT